MRSPRRFGHRLMRPSIVAITAALLALTACASDQDDESSPSGDGPGFPVSITHAHGTTTIESEPTRVVTVGYTDPEPVLALGVKPVGVMEWFGKDIDRTWPWVKDRWGSTVPEYVGTNASGTLAFEKIAALEPDLILGLYADLSKEEYDKLSAIAPTVAQSPDHAPYTTPWTEMTQTAGLALGRADEAKELIDDIEASFAAAREEHPEFADQTAAVVDAGDGNFFPFSAKDPRGVFLSSLGFQAPQQLNDWLGSDFGNTLSKEHLGYLDVDRLIVLANEPAREQLATDHLYQQLDVVRDGRALEVPYDESPPVGAAVAYNSVLSIPYALETVVPQLAR